MDPVAIAREDEITRLGDEIAELSAQLDAATSRLLDLIREFDEQGYWGNGSGFLSCAHWLSYRTSVELSTARERVRVARALGTLPRLKQALASGELSYAKVRAATRVATPETEERLLKLGREASAAQLELVVRGWRWVDRHAEVHDTKQQHWTRALQVSQDDDGTFVVRGRLSPEAGAVLVRALDAAHEVLYQRGQPDNDPPTTGQARADALVLIAEAALRHELDPGAAGERYQVVVHVDAAVLADAEQPGQSVLEDGVRVSAETSQRLACDASRVVMRHDEAGNIVEVGARTRTIPPALRRALRHRDRRCQFPACERRFGDGHHIRHWAQGGPTTLSNLALLCRRHHRAVHEEGYTVERQRSGAVMFRWPSGQPIPNVPPPVQVPVDPVGLFRATHRELDLSLDAETTRPGWSAGEGLDVGYAISVLHPLAIRPSTMA